MEYEAGQELPGTVYRVVRHLATGGMGSVYEVEDTSVGKRYVLKTLHPQLVARDDLARRMKEEARVLAKLEHPNIVDVVTAGVTKERQPMPFYVMERLNGQNLRSVLEKKGVLELPAAYQIAIDVLDALEHAHENAVIHRDVKPENIFLHRNANGTTTTKLLDFGIMRLLDKNSSQTQGQFIGTLRYASPEQLTGGKLGPGTDIYSLGMVLYEMLAGRGPFDEIVELFAVGAAHVNLAPPALSTFVRVPLAVEQLVMSSLAKTAVARPKDCHAFAAELRRIRREQETSPRVNVVGSMVSHAADAYTGTEPGRGPGLLPLSSTRPPDALGGLADSAPFAELPPRVMRETGPLSGEARTRPPEDRRALVLGVLTAFAVIVVGLGVLFFTKPWIRAVSPAGSASAVAVMTAPPLSILPVAVAAGAAPSIAAALPPVPAAPSASLTKMTSAVKVVVRQPPTPLPPAPPVATPAAVAPKKPPATPTTSPHNVPFD